MANNVVIVGSNPARVEEERQAEIARRQTRGESLEGITTSVKPIVQPSGLTQYGRNKIPPISVSPFESPLTGGGKFTGLGEIPRVITSDVIAPATDLSSRITTPQPTPIIPVSSLPGIDLSFLPPEQRK